MKKNFVGGLLYDYLKLSMSGSVEKERVNMLLEAARRVADERGTRVLRVYTPSRFFPSVSVTGARCELNCAHCGGRYLSHMIQAETPEKLYEVCVSLQKSGAVGCLISGGSTREGYVPLEPFVDAIRRVKDETGLILNVHTGLISYELARKLAVAGVDVVSLDVVGDTDTVRMVYGLEKRAEDYFEALKTHFKAGLRHVVPHVCIGLHYGRLRGEVRALEVIKGFKPEKLVFIVLIPARGTRMESVPPPDPEDVAAIVAAARLMLRDTEIILGCMRPLGRVRDEIDVLALDLVDGIVLPSRKTVREAESRGFRVKRLSSCCAVPREYEPIVDAKAEAARTAP